MPVKTYPASGGDVSTDSIFDAKGDLVVGTGADTAIRLAVGTDTFILTADAAEAGGMKWVALGGGGDALTANPLSQFAATTSLQLLGVLSDETGTGLAVFNNAPTFIAPVLGTPASGVATNLTGTAASLTVGGVTVADESTDTTCFPLFTTAATGDLPPKSGTNLTFNSNTGALAATSFVGPLTGEADTVATIAGLAPNTATTAAAQANITSLGVLTALQMSGDVNLDGNNIDNGGVIFLIEQAEADPDVAGSGQFWVNTATPNEAYFTDDAGTDFQLGVGGGGVTIGDAITSGTADRLIYEDAGNLAAESASLTYTGTTGQLTLDPVGVGDTSLSITPLTGFTAEAINVSNAGIGGTTTDLALIKASMTFTTTTIGGEQFAVYAEGLNCESNGLQGGFHGYATRIVSSGVGNACGVFGECNTNTAGADLSGVVGYVTTVNSATSEGFGGVFVASGNTSTHTVPRVGVYGSARRGTSASHHGGFFTLNDATTDYASPGNIVTIGEESSLGVLCKNDDVGQIIKLNSSQTADAFQVTSDAGTAGDVARISATGSIFLDEKTAADADVAAKGQIWIKDDAPNKLYFTDDAGTDHEIAFV